MDKTYTIDPDATAGNDPAEDMEEMPDTPVTSQEAPEGQEEEDEITPHQPTKETLTDEERPYSTWGTICQ